MTIKQLIQTIDSIQKIKQWNVNEFQINILFDEDLVLYTDAIIKFHMQSFSSLVEPDVVIINNNKIKIKLKESGGSYEHLQFLRTRSKY